MKSTTSVINKGILLNDLRRFFWLGIIYLLGMLAAVPLQIFMIFNRGGQTTINGVSIYLRALDYSSSFQFLLLVVMPVLTGLLLFRYLQVSNASDTEHTLPIRRATLFNTHVLAGNILLLAPLLVTALVTWLTAAELGIEAVNGGAVLTWLGVCLLFNLLFFMTTAAVGTFTGMTSLQGILTYILLLLPTGLSILLLENLNIFIYGFAYGHYSNTSVNSFSPLLRLENAFSDPLPTGIVVLYLLLIAVLHLLGRYMYQQRPLEKAGNAVVFESLAQVLKYGVVFCSMLLAGGYFYASQGSISWAFFGYLLGSGLAYIFMEVLLNKSLNIFQWQRFKGYGFYAGLVIVLVIILNYDVTGFEKQGPELSEVQSIYMDYSFYALDSRAARHVVYDPQSAYPYDAYEDERVLPVYKNPDNLADIYALHQAIINNRTKGKAVKPGYGSGLEPLCLAYEMKDGSRLYRQYLISRKDYDNLLKPIYESPEFKIIRYDILRIKPSEALLIEINTPEGNKQLRISRSDLIEQAISALQEDVYKQSYTEITSSKASWAEISISLNQRRMVHTSWQKSFTHFENWLVENGLYNQARLLPGEDIKFALVKKKSDTGAPGSQTERVNSSNIADFSQQPGVITIQEAAELEQCLRSYHYSSNEPSVYFIAFVLKNDRILQGVFPEAEAPDFVKERIK